VAVGISPSVIDEVILGCANQAGEDNRNVARMAILLAELSESIPGYTVNRLCASGLTAIANAHLQIAGGEAEVVVAGGVESMSRAPWVSARPTKPFSGPTEVVDSALGWRFINPRMGEIDEGNATVSLGETAERVAKLDGISRQRSDEFALRSQNLTTAALTNGNLKGEVIQMDSRLWKISQDEAPRSDVTLGQLSGLAPAFRSDGIVTAGSACPSM